jgi:predicted RNA-binding Zn-ribbon protein involved in translation (DUF1610 family)
MSKKQPEYVCPHCGSDGYPRSDSPWVNQHGDSPSTEINGENLTTWRPEFDDARDCGPWEEYDFGAFDWGSGFFLCPECGQAVISPIPRDLWVARRCIAGALAVGLRADDAKLLRLAKALATHLDTL